MKVLLVEEDATACLTFEQDLQAMGYEVTACANAETALEAYQHTFYPLILLNLGLPGMDGFECCRRFRSLPQGDHSMILVLTAHAKQDTLKAALDAGADDYLTKPVDRGQLQTRLSVLERQFHHRIKQQQTDQALHASEQQYHLLIQSVANGIGIIQEDKLVFVNEALTAMLGYSSDQLLERSPVDLFHDDYKTHIKKRNDHIDADPLDARWQLLQCIATNDNREVWIEGRYETITWQARPAVLMIVRDITKRKLRELEIEKEKKALERENIRLRSNMKDRYQFGELVGKSPAMQEVYELILEAADSDANVVIYGESGTGKELIAQTIHQMSKRKEKVFVPVNCGAIPENLFESELFGYRKGAFTGAYRNKPGFFDLAHTGTLFLDEVGELNLAMQAKLLRAVEGRGFTPLGDKSIKKTAIRIIAATNKNLEKMVKKKEMREDFFYRLHVIEITVPPLRERQEDIPLLLDHFLKQYGTDVTWQMLPEDVIAALYKYDWPGNVRELQNVLQRYLATKRLIFKGFRETKHAQKESVSGIETFAPEGQKLSKAVEQFEKHYIHSILEQNRWSRTKTATILGIDLKTLYRKMKRYKLE
jgi:PAS domain S-box-containing protein